MRWKRRLKGWVAFQGNKVVARFRDRGGVYLDDGRYWLQAVNFQRAREWAERMAGRWPLLHGPTFLVHADGTVEQREIPSVPLYVVREVQVLGYPMADSRERVFTGEQWGLAYRDGDTGTYADLLIRVYVETGADQRIVGRTASAALNRMRDVLDRRHLTPA